MRCENCNTTLRDDSSCPGCELYNAAVAAQKAAALHLAKERIERILPGARGRVTDAWINDHGCFATVPGVCGVQVASVVEVAPFRELFRSIYSGAQPTDESEGE